MGCIGSRMDGRGGPRRSGGCCSVRLHSGYRRRRNSERNSAAAALDMLLLDRDLGFDGEVMMKCDNDDAPFFAAGTATRKEYGQVKTRPENRTQGSSRTPISTPQNEPEVIDAWEIMAGLENASPLNLRRTTDVSDEKGPNEKSSSGSGGGDWSAAGIVEARVKEFQRKIDAKRSAAAAAAAAEANRKRSPPDSAGKVVLYFTSLRGVRRTFEDSWAARMILKGYDVRVDERDLSLHTAYKAELLGALGPGCGLPRVFSNGEYVGGVEELRHLHEAGKLRKVLEACQRAAGCSAACEGCGDVRFVPCGTCSGSRKVYCDAALQATEVAAELGGFRMCPACNENGLVRCPLCSC
ncbi:uncharacterized protein At3g28850-like [Zingiber officinale]|uniref:Glutaredoxin domain-containing protein n=1 Tax=Zingiber officinale TaxID=94328 RepID=A0A8J5KNA4_ZINOF|nr:uncharacterized protein At3g28850-like [Zingiber officinale]KAG6494266.1 hypothetical protein ZIOFF_049287 [Zingiber officinale]